MNKTTSNKELQGAIALIVLAIIYGFIGFFARELAPGLTLFQQQYLRLIPGSIFLWLIFYKHISLTRCFHLIKQEPLLVILRSACLYAVSIPLYFYAVQNTKLGNVALLQVLPYVFIIGALVNKEKITKAKLILMLFAFFGASLVATKEGFDLFNIGRGELASIVSGALISLGFVTRKKHRSKANDYEISLTLIGIGALITLLLSLMMGDGIPNSTLTLSKFSILLLLAAFLNSGIILLANYGFSKVRDTLANNIIALEGIFGLLFGYFIYSEIPQVRELFGAIIILNVAFASTYIIRRESRKQTNV